MNKLSTKPNPDFPLKSWEDLDRLLQANFKFSKLTQSVSIDIADYDMTVEEVKNEAIKAGYKVDVGSKKITFY
ncbi:hypothetical protein G7062_00040 [Erysipelothrix sp. HDW6C]|uniref:hypothetical protein n=1 Tax=Erysipelothrix sp. HDW6C TaxID=2714930 RepID=UPI00140A4CB0|nr:hypothetical protein [Erysipelothrix sp. HDW6C]QIK68765.1 hypothetical protein G7062_00040 [Erysipelothrix sp. HDW6C]